MVVRRGGMLCGERAVVYGGREVVVRWVEGGGVCVVVRRSCGGRAR